MNRRLALALALVALVVPATALAAFPGPYATQGGQGVLSQDGSMRFLALGAGESTVLSMKRVDDGTAVRSHTVAGSFGVPVLTPNGVAGGMFHDGSAFVLQSVGILPTTQFMLVGTQDLAPRDSIALKGTFGFDALSPDGSRMYLIQHTSTQDVQHYVVRAYDLNAHKLLPGRIADKTQKGWVMQGWAVSRASTANGRWVYTLYANPGGMPFIHALDTVRGVAHCVGIGWPAASSQDPVFNFSIALHGTSLVVGPKDGSAYRLVDTRNWKVTKPK